MVKIHKLIHCTTGYFLIEEVDDYAEVETRRSERQLSSSQETGELAATGFGNSLV